MPWQEPGLHLPGLTSCWCRYPGRFRWRESCPPGCLPLLDERESGLEAVSSEISVSSAASAEARLELRLDMKITKECTRSWQSGQGPVVRPAQVSSWCRGVTASVGNIERNMLAKVGRLGLQYCGSLSRQMLHAWVEK